MPKKLKVFLIIYFVCAISLSYFIITNANAAQLMSSSGHAAASPASNAYIVMKSASAVKSFDGKTLILKNKKQYALAGVKVFDLTQNRKNKKNLTNIMVAEMTFVNNRLTEVVITLK